MLITADRILFADTEDPVAGYVHIDGDRIVSAGAGEPPKTADEHLSGIVVPGYVDVHSHGGGGASFVTEDPASARRVLAAHRALGTTSMVASLVRGPMPQVARQVRVLADLVESGELAGIHLEGPWPTDAYRPQRDGAFMDAEAGSLDDLVTAGRGAVRMVTIAPERPGAIEAIRGLTSRGVLAAIGHSAADYDTCREAIDAGVRGATHLFNAMVPQHHREPGPVLALWEDPRVVLELIMDGVHLRSELGAFVMRTAPGRVALVTDAIAAAAAPDGDYVLGAVDVHVRARIARVAGTDRIAGSTLTLDQAVRNAIDAGIPLQQAVRSATAVPADYLGLADVGRIAADKRADLVVLDDEYDVVQVMWRGVWQ